MRSRCRPTRPLIAPAFATPLAALLVALFAAQSACDGPSATAPTGSPALSPVAQTTPHDGPSEAPAALCERLVEEHGELGLGAPLRARILGLPAAAAAWIAQNSASGDSGNSASGDSGNSAAGALERLLGAPNDADALQAVHHHASAFEQAPALLVDATLGAVLAIDASCAPGDNGPTVRALARAREWLPHEPSVPWLEALLLPERGGRRRLLAEAHAAGGDHPALLLALARAALRDGDSRITLDLIERARAAAEPGTEPLGRALHERAAAAERARATLRITSHVGIEVRAPRGVDEPTSNRLAAAVRANLDEAAAFLGQPRRASLSVWVHPDLADLRAATCGASWSAALYDGVLHVALTTGELDALLLQSVRHEALHAQLDDATPLAPRWFHEGVAQRFALEPLAEGAPHVALSAAMLEETERGLTPTAPGAAAGHAYAAARALVDALVARDGQGVVRSTVAALRAGLPARDLAQHLRLVGVPPAEAPPPP